MRCSSGRVEQEMLPAGRQCISMRGLISSELFALLTSSVDKYFYTLAGVIWMSERHWLVCQGISVRSRSGSGTLIFPENFILTFGSSSAVGLVKRWNGVVWEEALLFHYWKAFFLGVQACARRVAARKVFFVFCSFGAMVSSRWYARNLEEQCRSEMFPLQL